MKISGKAKKNITTPKGGGFLSYIKNRLALHFLSSKSWINAISLIFINMTSHRKKLFTFQSDE
jgi:hypothetical protein